MTIKRRHNFEVLTSTGPFIQIIRMFICSQTDPENRVITELYTDDVFDPDESKSSVHR